MSFILDGDEKQSNINFWFLAEDTKTTNVMLNKTLNYLRIMKYSRERYLL